MARRVLVSFTLLFILIMPAADALSLSISTPLSAERDPKISPALRAEFGLDAPLEGVSHMVPERRVSVLAIGEVTGTTLRDHLAADGFHTLSAGRMMVDVLVRYPQLAALAQRADVGYVYPAFETQPSYANVTTEGYAALEADVVHALGRSGEGVKVAIFDHGFDANSSELAGRVAGTKTFDGSAINSGATVHGTACAEIIADIAPGASLYLVKTQFLTDIEEGLNWAITNDMDVVSMSLGFPLGPFDGTSPVAQAIDAASNAGVLVVLSNGNSARHHWSGTPGDADNDRWLDIDPPYEAVSFTIQAGQTVTADLSWNDYPVSANDYDLALVDGSNNVLAVSVNVQSGHQLPWETVSYTSSSTRTLYLAIRNYNASGGHTFHLFLDHNGPIFNTMHQVRAGSVTQFATAREAITVGAGDVAGPHAVHTYSSEGPTSDGRMAPLVTSAAGVSTLAYGPENFYGTSASAPHVAAMLALVRQEAPTMARAEAGRILALASEDLGATGPDNATGYGWPSAYGALYFADITAPSVLDAAPALNGSNLTLDLLFNDVLRGAGNVSVDHESGDSLELATKSILGKEWSGSTPLNVSFPDGRVLVHVSQFADWADNVMPATVELGPWILDRFPPILTLGSLPAAAANAFALTWNATDAGTGVAQVTLEHAIDGGAFEPWFTTPLTAGSAAWTNLSHESVAFRVTATDGLGAVVTALTPIVTIDTAAPEITLMLEGVAGNLGWYTSAVTATVVANDSAGLSAFSYILDGVTTNVSGNGTSIPIAGEGLHTLRVSAADTLGNTVTTAASEVRIDTAAPALNHTLDGTRGHADWFTSPVTITWTATDATSGVGTSEVLLDGVLLSSSTGTATADGVHSLAWNVSDIAGHYTAGNMTFRLDATAPVVGTPTLSRPDVSLGAFVTVSIPVTEAFVSSVSVTMTSPSGGSLTIPASLSDTNWTAEIGPFHEVGAWTIAAHASDEAGNEGQGPPLDLTAGDLRPPNLEITEPLDPMVMGNVTLRAEVDDPDATVTFRVDATPLIEGSNGTLVWATLGVPNGWHNVSATATDPDGNAVTTTRAFFVANAPTFDAVTTTPEATDETLQPNVRIDLTARATSYGGALTWYLLREVNGDFRILTDPSMAQGAATFELSASLAPGSFLSYALVVVDAAGVAATWPDDGMVTLQTDLAPDPSGWTGAQDAGSGEVIDHAFADIQTARVTQNGGDLLFGMTLRAAIDGTQDVKYIVNFDTNADGVVDQNLTATYPPGAGPISWGTTLQHEGGAGVTPPLPTAIAVSADGASLVIKVRAADLLARLGSPSSLGVSFRTLGSEDQTGTVSVTPDLTPPTVQVVAGTSALSGNTITFSADVIDATGIASVRMQYAMNGGTPTDAGAPTSSGARYTWSIPSSVVVPGTLRWDLTARDTPGNARALAGNISVADATPLTGTLVAPLILAQGAAGAFGVSSPSANVVSYTWTFGDGTSAAGRDVTHIYGTPGTKLVNVTLRDAQGRTAILSGSVSVADVLPPTVSITSPAANAYVPAAQLDVIVSASDAGGIASAAASIDGGASWRDAPLAGVRTATFDLSGYAGQLNTLQLKAKATDTAGLTTQSSPRSITVDGIAPVARAGDDRSIQVGSPLTLSAAASTDNVAIASYAWTLGDGTTIVGPTTTHTYAIAGVFVARLTVTDVAGNTHSDDASITVTAIPTPPPPPPPPPPSSPPAPPPAIVPAAPVAPVPSAVVDLPPTIVIIQTRAPGRVGDSIGFRADVTDENPETVAITWDFGDGATPTGAIVEHVFALEGTHVVRAVATDATGKTGETTLIVTITRAPRPPTLSLAATFPQGEGDPGQITLRARATNATSVMWDLDGDGEFEVDGTEVTVTRIVAGAWRVAARAVGEDGTVEQSLVVQIVDLPPTASFGLVRENGKSTVKATVSDLNGDLYDVSCTDANGRVLLGDSIPVDSLAPGEYTFECIVTSGTHKVEKQVTFQIFANESALEAIPLERTPVAQEPATGDETPPGNPIPGAPMLWSALVVSVVATLWRRRRS